MLKNRKGFTLIELLIVIVIMGILAVAFLPTVLGSPAAARDVKRLADLQKIQKVMIGGFVDGINLPSASGCVNSTLMAPYLPELGGVIPIENISTATIPLNAATVTPECEGTYAYVLNPAGSNRYDFALYARMEKSENGNITCTDLGVVANEDLSSATAPTAASDSCYALLTNL